MSVWYKTHYKCHQVKIFCSSVKQTSIVTAVYYISLSSSCNYLMISKATKKERSKTCERERKSGGWIKEDERPQAGDGLSRAELLEARGWQTFTFHQANLWAPVSWLIHPDASWRRTDWLHNRPPSTIYPSRLNVTHLNPVWCRSIYFHLLISGAC